MSVEILVFLSVPLIIKSHRCEENPWFDFKSIATLHNTLKHNLIAANIPLYGCQLAPSMCCNAMKAEAVIVF